MSYWLHSDQEVQVDLARTHQTVANNQVFQPKMMKAKITSISLENGALTAINSLTQEKIELHPDGNSFDFMKGLICRKI